MPQVTHEYLDRIDRIDQENEELHDTVRRDDEMLSQIGEAWLAIDRHPGITIRCDGDDAAETYNRLSRLLDPYILKTN